MSCDDGRSLAGSWCVGTFGYSITYDSRYMVVSSTARVGVNAKVA